MPQLSLREECRSYMLQLRPHTAKQINNFFKDIKKKKIHSSLIAELTISVAVWVQLIFYDMQIGNGEFWIMIWRVRGRNIWLGWSQAEPSIWSHSVQLFMYLFNSTTCQHPSSKLPSCKIQTRKTLSCFPSICKSPFPFLPAQTWRSHDYLYNQTPFQKLMSLWGNAL